MIPPIENTDPYCEFPNIQGPEQPSAEDERSVYPQLDPDLIEFFNQALEDEPGLKNLPDIRSLEAKSPSGQLLTALKIANAFCDFNSNYLYWRYQLSDMIALKARELEVSQSLDFLNQALTLIITKSSTIDCHTVALLGQALIEVSQDYEPSLFAIIEVSSAYSLVVEYSNNRHQIDTISQRILHLVQRNDLTAINRMHLADPLIKAWYYSQDYQIKQPLLREIYQRSRKEFADDDSNYEVFCHEIQIMVSALGAIPQGSIIQMKQPLEILVTFTTLELDDETMELLIHHLDQILFTPISVVQKHDVFKPFASVRRGCIFPVAALQRDPDLLMALRGNLIRLAEKANDPDLAGLIENLLGKIENFEDWQALSIMPA
ncbi:MAG: hypothetical protein ACQEP8_00575 [Chlamydiota bacterium]